MANDPPSHLRMGFGFQQARAAGAPYAAPPTPDQMNFHLREKAAEKKLRTLVLKKPSLAVLVRQYARPRDGGNYLTTQQILFLVECINASNAKNGFVIVGKNGTSYQGEKINDIYLDGLSFVHGGKSSFFHVNFIKEIIVDEVED